MRNRKELNQEFHCEFITGSSQVDVYRSEYNEHVGSLIDGEWSNDKVPSELKAKVEEIFDGASGQGDELRKAILKFDELESVQIVKKYKKGWIYHRLVEFFGDEVALQVWEERKRQWKADRLQEEINGAQPRQYKALTVKGCQEAALLDALDAKEEDHGSYPTSLYSKGDGGARKSVMREMASQKVCTCDSFDLIEDGCWCGAEYNPYRGMQ